jgi:nucleotide-binding universal stress UspA family protein
MYRRVLVGTDLSATAARAVERAAMVAEGAGAELTLLYAGSDPGEGLQTLAKEYGAEAVAVPGSPAEVIVNQANERDADLVVVGSVGMSGARRFLLGSVPNKVSHHATRDVLIVKTDAGHENAIEPWRKILVGTDGSETATRAVDMAANLGKALGIHTTVVCAYQPPSEHELHQMKADPNDVSALWDHDASSGDVPDEFRWRISAASQAEDVLERARQHAEALGQDADIRAVEGHPADVLIKVAEAEGYDVIAVGNVGMTGAKRFMLGNVPHRVSHHAPTDVLIFKTS